MNNHIVPNEQLDEKSIITGIAYATPLYPADRYVFIR